jgi:hypothetical protein
LISLIFIFAPCCYASTAISGLQQTLSTDSPTPGSSYRSEQQQHPPFLYRQRSKRTLLPLPNDIHRPWFRRQPTSPDFLLIARMTRTWNRSDCPACRVGAGLDGSIASRPRGPAVSEPCRHHQPDMAHQHHFTSDPIRKTTSPASASSHILHRGSIPRTERQARRHHERTQAVDALEITMTRPVAMLHALDVPVGGVR